MICADDRKRRFVVVANRRPRAGTPVEAKVEVLLRPSFQIAFDHRTDHAFDSPADRRAKHKT